MDTKALIEQQIQEMDRHKWIESEKAGCDLGQKAMLDWAENFMNEPFTKERSSQESPAKKRIPQAK
ncbi:MAG: hypothetical protein MK132_02575 [Lentisphaerales bacterium]|nr:hypothetical protein [Lentisphaerales bacterium]